MSIPFASYVKYLLLLLAFNFTVLNGSAVEHPKNENEEYFEAEHAVEGLHSEESHSEDHHSDTRPLLFIILAIVIGGLTRFLLKNSILPFTVALLIIGMGLGVLGRFDLLHQINLGSFEMNISALDGAINWAGNIDPHMLLYVFLPILIFEAAFAMDVHVFKKTIGNATLLAVPGIILAMLLTAVVIIAIVTTGMGLPLWDWKMAMLFGAVVSATDPVAVVSILKELGASKKLGTLIEGESLLNDGTAIVIFMVLLAGFTGGDATSASPILIFLKVSFGGILLGAGIGWIIIKWIKRVFNDSLVEISAIVGASYLTFFIAENVFGVSGVLAIVTLGLLMASVGRTKISPEVQHFLHEFWELAAFFANVLIFLIVGVVIAERTVFEGSDVLLLLMIYVAVFILRGIIIGSFFPLMKKMGYGINKNNATVLWWGALRGAIGLALALIVHGTDAIDIEIRDQFLFLTAGIVTLTLLVNATTIKWLVRKLGMLDLSPSKIALVQSTDQYVIQSSEKNIERLKKDRFLKRAEWNKVKGFVYKRRDVPEVSENVDSTIEIRRRLLEKEKSSYWKQFKEGMLSPEAYQTLTEEINEILDGKGESSLSKRNDLEEMLMVGSRWKRVKGIPLVGKILQKEFYKQLAISYDCAKGFVEAQEDCFKLLESMIRNSSEENEEEQTALKQVQLELEENKITGLTFLRNIGKEFPEVYSAIATRKAIRSVLNYEKHTIERLYKNGRLNLNEASVLQQEVESRMKKLRDSELRISVPNEKELIKEASWLDGMNEEQVETILKGFLVKNFNAEEVLFKANDSIDSVFILCRGEVELIKDDASMEAMGVGSFLGGIGGLKVGGRRYTAKTLVPSTVLWMTGDKWKSMIDQFPSLKNSLWREMAKQLSFELLMSVEPYNRYSKNKLHRKLTEGKLVFLENETINLFNETAILVHGTVNSSLGEISGPQVLPNTQFSAIGEVILYKLP